MTAQRLTPLMLCCAIVVIGACGGGGKVSEPSRTVRSVAVTGSSSLTRGQTAPFTAVATWSDGATEAIGSGGAWSSSNNAVATVSAAGLVTAVAAGSAEIRVTFQNVAGAAPLTVTAGVATLSSLTLAGTTTLSPGQSAPWAATAGFSDGSTQNVSSSVAWSSSNAAVATVSPARMVTAIAAGSADIRAQYQGLSQTRAVQVTAAVVSVTAAFTVIPNSDTNLPTGQCAVAQSGANNLFRCRFDAGRSTPNPGITSYQWEVPVGGTTFSGAVLADITVPCTVGGLAGSGAIDRPVRLTVTAPGGTVTATQTVTFIRASAC